MPPGEFFTFGLTSIPALILGYKARGQIRQTGEAGDGLAVTGLILGWLAVVLWLLFWVFVLVGFAAFSHTSGGVRPGP